MDHIASTAIRFLADESGVTAIEYGLLAALIVVAAVGVITATGDSLSAMYTRWTEAVVRALTGGG